MGEVKLRCPDCGSEEVREWQKVPIAYAIEGVKVEGNGNVSIEYGESGIHTVVLVADAGE